MEAGQLAFGIALVVVGLGLVVVTIGKPKDWGPRLARAIPFAGWPAASGRDKVRALGYIATGTGVLYLIRVLVFRV